jgi:hypothetical protein
MATTNPVSQLLATSGNQGLLAAGSRVDALAVGQLGVFNFHTGLSIDGSVPADAKDIFLAVGTDINGVGSLQDINKSAGQVLQVRNMRALTYKGYLAALPKIIDLDGFTAKCDTDYAIKIEFRNAEVYATNGYNQFSKPFNVHTGCCADLCEDCGDGDPSEISVGLVNNINADPDHLVTASYFVNAITATVAAEPTAAGDIVVTVGTTAYTVAIVDADTVTTAAAKIVAKINSQTDSPYRAVNVAGVITIYPKKTITGSTDTLVYTTPVAGMTITPIVAATKTTVANATTFLAANPGVGLGVRLTSNPAATYTFNDINLKYYKMRSTDMIVSLVDGFKCNGTVTTIQELQYSDGNGYDLKQEEYVDGGWNGKPGPYRQSEVTGLARQGFQYYINPTANYNVFVLAYDQFSVGGWLEYLNNLETVLAIPCADATTVAAVATVFDLIFTQFGGMAGDVAANGDCTNAATSTLTPATDGIESLA